MFRAGLSAMIVSRSQLLAAAEPPAFQNIEPFRSGVSMGSIDQTRDHPHECRARRETGAKCKILAVTLPPDLDVDAQRHFFRCFAISQNLNDEAVHPLGLGSHRAWRGRIRGT